MPLASVSLSVKRVRVKVAMRVRRDGPKWDDPYSKRTTPPQNLSVPAGKPWPLPASLPVLCAGWARGPAGQVDQRRPCPLLLSSADRAKHFLSSCACFSRPAANSSLLGGCHPLPSSRKLPFFPHLGSGFNFYSILFNNNA